jgi:hypothetical protein
VGVYVSIVSCGQFPSGKNIETVSCGAYQFEQPSASSLTKSAQGFDCRVKGQFVLVGGSNQLDAQGKIQAGGLFDEMALVTEIFVHDCITLIL